MSEKIYSRRMSMIFVFILMLFLLGGVEANAASYSSNYQEWSQGASDDSGMREVGCWIVAQAKLLYEANVDRSASFNPDTYFRWQVNNGCLVNVYAGNYSQTDGGNAPVKYANQKGKNLEYLGWWDPSDSQLWYNINAGYFTILHVKWYNQGIECHHYVMIANELSKAKNQLYFYESYNDESFASPRPLSNYANRTRVGTYVYKASNPVHTHNYSSVITKQPTCTATGVRTYSCSCGNNYTETIAALGHKYVNTTVDPTTVSSGYTLHTCSVCGNTYKDNYINPVIVKDGWSYSDVLPTGITADKYTIEYKNYYEKIQSSSPGSGWTNAGQVKNEWQNSGAQYTSYTDLATSDSRILVSSVFYHFCGPNAGNEGNYEQSGNFVHYDSISASAVTAQYLGNDNGHPYYFLYWSNGAQVYCKSGDTCDGAWGTHGYRCRAWYKENTYQDRVKVVLYKYTKESDWTKSKDISATKVIYKYQLKHTHQYASAITQKATCASDGIMTFTCACGDSYTQPIAKASVHTWDNGKIVKTATTKENGEKCFTCTICGATRTEVIKASGSVEKTPDQPQDQTTQKPETNPTSTDKESVSQVEQQANAMPENGDLKRSDFGTLQARAVSIKNTSIKLSWKKVPNASGYIIYGNKCGKKHVKLADVKGKKWTQKKLKKGTYYKYMVVAYDASGHILASSKTIHAATSGGKYGNIQLLQLNKTKVTLKKNKTFKLKTKTVKEAGKTIKIHRKIAYESTNTSIATVDKNGKIKALSKGSCYIYVYAQNGIFARIHVTVKS